LVPQGYDAPTGLAATPAGTGVWFIADSSDARTVFHWSDSTHQLTRFALSMSDPDLASGASTPMAVDSTSRVWIGINRTLVAIDPAKAAVATYRLPPMKLVNSSLETLPFAPSGVSLQEFALIESRTVDSSGGVVIGRQFPSALDVFDPTSGRFSEIPLPGGTALAGFENKLIAGPMGEIDTLLDDGSGTARLGMWSASGWSSVEPSCPPLSLLPGTIVGESCIEIRTGGVGTLAATARRVAGGWVARSPQITFGTWLGQRRLGCRYRS
jgi:hypothetical protein